MNPELIRQNLCTFVNSGLLFNPVQKNKLKNMIEDKNPQRTSIAQLGEFALIDHLTKKL
jgi:hypothetical protein